MPRKRWLAGTVTDERFAAAVGDLAQLDLERYPTLRFMRRAFELRANVTAYDSAYVALAEELGCNRDRRSAPSQRDRPSMPHPRAAMKPVGRGGDDDPGCHRGGRDGQQAAGQSPGEPGCGGQPEPGAGQRADHPDDRALGDHQPGQRGIPPAEAAHGGQLSRPLSDVQEHHVGDGQPPQSAAG